MTGTLEPANQPYAVAKIAGIKLCESYNRQHGRDFRRVMPSNRYGPSAIFHPENPGRFIFLDVDDMAATNVHVMEQEAATYQAHTQPILYHINVGTGVGWTIGELAETVAQVTGFDPELQWDSSKPDGTPRKLLNVSRLRALGWKALIGLVEGLRDCVSVVFAASEADSGVGVCSSAQLSSRGLAAKGGPARVGVRVRRAKADGRHSVSFAGPSGFSSEVWRSPGWIDS